MKMEYKTSFQSDSILNVSATKIAIWMQSNGT